MTSEDNCILNASLRRKDVGAHLGKEESKMRGLTYQSCNLWTEVLVGVIVLVEAFRTRLKLASIGGRCSSIEWMSFLLSLEHAFATSSDAQTAHYSLRKQTTVETVETVEVRGLCKAANY